MIAALALLATAALSTPQDSSLWQYKKYNLEGWELNVRTDLFKPETSAKTYEAMGMLSEQLRWITETLPAPAVQKMKKVRLYFSPPFPDSVPNAAYHPSKEWLRENKRDPQMAKCVEFTNVLIFKQEVDRMPVFALHELAHAYHDQVLGWNHKEILDLYEKAKANKSYESVTLVKTGQKVRHYGLNNQMEYFAEATEAYFGKNDFYPSNREELIKHDPEMARLLRKIWYEE
jgi:hypothetical protein